MSKIKPERACEKQRVRKFGGIRSNAILSGESALDVKNFRIRADGSLEKRSGYRTLYQVSAVCRGTWQGSIEGSHYFFFASGDSIYGVLPGSQSPTLLYSLTTSSGEVGFAFYRNTLYFFDGKVILRFKPSIETFSEAYGYVPLYGKNWHPTQLGTVNEPQNMATPRLRLHYLNTIASQDFQLPFTTESVDAVKVNGVPIYNYTFTPQTSTFRIPPNSGGTVEVAFTISSVFNQRSLLARAFRTEVLRDRTHETLFTYGGSPGYTVYRTAAVTEEMLRASQAAYSGTDALYVKVDSAFSVGDAQHPILSLVRDGERMLVLNDRDLWTIRHDNDGDDTATVERIPDGIGCSSPKGVAVCEGSIVVLRDSGVYQLHFSSGSPSVLTARSLSAQITDLLTPQLLQNGVLYWMRDRNELWLRDPADPLGTVWVRNAEREDWVCFDHINALFFFEEPGGMHCFAAPDGKIYCFDDTAATDASAPIVASYQSHYLNFSNPETAKRALRVFLCAETNGTPATLRLETDRNSADFSVTGTSLGAPAFLDCRFIPGRFRFLRFRITDNAGFRSRFYFLSVSANR